MKNRLFALLMAVLLLVCLALGAAAPVAAAAAPVPAAVAPVPVPAAVAPAVPIARPWTDHLKHVRLQYVAGTFWLTYPETWLDATLLPSEVDKTEDGYYLLPLSADEYVWLWTAMAENVRTNQYFSAEFYDSPDIESIAYSEDFTTVTIHTMGATFDMAKNYFASTSAAMGSALMQAVSGVWFDEIAVSLVFVNAETGKTIFTSTYKPSDD